MRVRTLDSAQRYALRSPRAQSRGVCASVMLDVHFSIAGWKVALLFAPGGRAGLIWIKRRFSDAKPCFAVVGFVPLVPTIPAIWRVVCGGGVGSPYCPVPS